MQSDVDQSHRNPIATAIVTNETWTASELRFIEQLRNAEPLTRARALALLYAGRSNSLPPKS